MMGKALRLSQCHTHQLIHMIGLLAFNDMQLEPFHPRGMHYLNHKSFENFFDRVITWISVAKALDISGSCAWKFQPLEALKLTNLATKALKVNQR